MNTHVGFQSAEIHSNFLIRKNIVLQNTLSGNYWELHKPLNINLSRRLSLGLGYQFQLFSNNQYFTSANWGISKANSSLETSANAIEALFGNPWPADAQIEGTQRHLNFTIAQIKPGRRKKDFKWINSLSLEYTQIPSLKIEYHIYSDIDESRTEYHKHLKNATYTVLTMQSQASFGNGLFITFGLKLPFSENEELFSQQFYITQEVVYLRLGNRIF
ncbi:MAG: hypothetical protein ACPGLV_03995 [Bacteroidia bacterium]